MKNRNHSRLLLIATTAIFIYSLLYQKPTTAIVAGVAFALAVGLTIWINIRRRKSDA